jgi:hypothetical protein
MAKPKLALIPSAQGSKFYSVLPSSGVGDFDFTRSGSATRINSQGLIESVGSGVSRLNYPMIDGVVSGCPHHILEPQRTQLVQYSEDFSQSYWIKSRTTVSANNIISPDGTLNADKIIETTDSGLHAVSKTFTVVSGVSHTVSVFIKKGTNKFFQILFGTNNVTNNPYVNFDVNQGVFENNGITSVDVKYFGNGWYRCSATVTTASTSLTYFISPIQSISDSRASSFTGSVNNNIYIYGAQLEQGSYPTSYIPNYGTAAGVTRSAETATGSGDADTFNDSEGVLMAEIAYLKDRGTSSPFKVERISISNATDTNRLFISNTAIANQIQVFVRNSTGISFNKTVTISDNTLYNKIVLKYKANDFSLWINGFELELDNTYSYLPSGLNVLKFEGASGSYDFYGKTKQLQYFDTALTDSELEQLTSWVSFQEMAEGQLYSIE